RLAEDAHLTDDLARPQNRHDHVAAVLLLDVNLDRAAQDEIDGLAHLLRRHQRHARGKGLAREQTAQRLQVVGRQIAEQANVQISQINVGLSLTVHTSSPVGGRQRTSKWFHLPTSMDTPSIAARLGWRGNRDRMRIVETQDFASLLVPSMSIRLSLVV